MLSKPVCRKPTSSDRLPLSNVPSLMAVTVACIRFWYLTSALLQLHIHSRLNTWLQWIGQRQLQDETGNILVLVFNSTYIRDSTAFLWMITGTEITSFRRNFHHWPTIFCLGGCFDVHAKCKITLKDISKNPPVSNHMEITQCANCVFLGL